MKNPVFKTDRILISRLSVVNMMLDKLGKLKYDLDDFKQVSWVEIERLTERTRLAYNQTCI